MNPRIPCCPRRAADDIFAEIDLITEPRRGQRLPLSCLRVPRLSRRRSA